MLYLHPPDTEPTSSAGDIITSALLQGSGRGEGKGGIRNERNGALGHHSALLRLYRARDNLG